MLLSRGVRRRSESGAVAPIVAILLGFGVITGMLALTADVGNVMWERRQLQNGADATALALARICAGDSDACSPVATGPALDPLLNANAQDRLNQFDRSRPGTSNGQCGQGTGNPAMPACTSPRSYTRLPDCPPRPGWLGSDIPFVETYTRTESGGGSTLLPSFFAGAITGVDPEVSVHACARAAWGSPASYTAEVPVTISICEWQRYMVSPGDYAVPPGHPWPGYGSAATQSPWPTAGEEITIYLKSTPSDPALATCTVNGKDTAGGYGYVDPTTGCAAIVTNGEWANIDTGSSAPSGCPDKFASLYGKVIALPIFDCLKKSMTRPVGPIPVGTDCTGNTPSSGGANTWYHIKGWATFYLSGYKIGGSIVKPSLRPGSTAGCAGGARCLTGWFVKGVLDDKGGDLAPPGGGFGPVVIRLAG